MADEKNKKEGKDGEAAKSEAAPKKSKLPLFAGGGLGALLLLAYVFASMAVPKKHVAPQLQGPFVAKLSNSELQVNLAGEGSKRYLVMSLTAEYVAYDEAFVKARTGAGGKPGEEDPQYAAMLTDSLLRIASTRTREEVTDPVLIDALLEEIRQEIDPVLFPVVLGDAKKANEADHESGLKPGESIHMATMRGLQRQHKLIVDAHSHTIQLDAGPQTRYRGDERDLKVVDQDGKTVYVDVTGVQKDFVGDVPVGAPGKLRRVLREKLLVQ
jgi:flagellar basal body-associated protein FliL